MKAIARVFLCFLMSDFASVPASAAEASSSEAAERKLVLMGASYVADWQQPSLPGFEVLNRGVGGEQTHEVLARFERDVLALQPDAVLIWGHINNVHRGGAERIDAVKQAAIRDYQEMVQRARAANIEVILATEVPLTEALGWRDRLVVWINNMRGKRSYAAWVNEHVGSVNDWLRTFAAAEGIQLLDFAKVFDDGEGFRKPEYTTPDGTHISPSGYAALTSYTQRILRDRRR